MYMQKMAKATRYEPPPRIGHAAVSIGNRLLLWGGYAGSDKSSKKLARAVEQFDILTEIWEKKTTFGTPPLGLWDTGCASIGASLYNIGGFDGTSQYKSLHELNTVSWEWKKLVAKNPSSAPMKKYGGGMVALDEENLLILAGRSGRCISDYTNELHVFNIPEGECCQPSDHSRNTTASELIIN